MERIDEIWNNLESKLSTVAGFFKIRYSDISKCDLYLGIKIPENYRILIIRIPIVKGKAFNLNYEFRGLKFEKVYDPDNSEFVLLNLVLVDSNIKDVFNSLILDLIENIIHENDINIILKKYSNRLLKWQNLFDKANLEGLSNEEQRGLFGELYFLRKFLSDTVNITLKIKSWTGPSKEIKDFQFGSWGLEVKTTSGNNHQKIHISNERQLDTSNIINLYLNHLSLELREGAGETLPEIVESIIEILKSDIPALNQFKNLLFEAGYFEHHRELYLSKGYLIRNNTYYKVEGDFPRLEENKIPSGVGDVKYSIIVSGCSEYIVAENEVLQNLVFNE